MAKAESEMTDLSTVIKIFLRKYARTFEGQKPTPKPIADKKKYPVLPEESKNQYKPSSSGLELARLLDLRIHENNPNAKPLSDVRLIDWAREADLMLNRDKRTKEQVIEVLEWCQHDEFWHSNVLSMAKLREQFDRLTLKMKDRSGSKNGKVRLVDNRPPPQLISTAQMAVETEWKSIPERDWKTMESSGFTVSYGNPALMIEEWKTWKQEPF